MGIASGALALVTAGMFGVLVLAITDLRQAQTSLGDSQTALQAVTELEKDVVDLETGGRGFAVTGQERFLGSFELGKASYRQDAQRLRSLVASEPAASRDARNLEAAVAAYLRDWQQPLVDLGRRDIEAARRRIATGEGTRRADAIRAQAGVIAARERDQADQSRSAADSRAQLAIGGAAVGLGVSVVLLVGFAIVMARSITYPVRRVTEAAARLAAGDLSVRVRGGRGGGEVQRLGQAFDDMAGAIEESQTKLENSQVELVSQRERLEYQQQVREGQVELAKGLQLTRSEQETYDVLSRHLERLPSSRLVTILVRDEAGEGLRPLTGPAQPALAGALERGTGADACLAGRLGRRYERGIGAGPLLSCQLCDAGDAASTCVPLVSGDQALGSVLVLHDAPPDDDVRQTVDESAAQAAAVLANHRNLRDARRQALADALTGIPNRRAFELELDRAVASAERRREPLSLVFLDLDRFKEVNDDLGHDKGNEVLGAVGSDAPSDRARHRCRRALRRRGVRRPAGRHRPRRRGGGGGQAPSRLPANRDPGPRSGRDREHGRGRPPARRPRRNGARPRRRPGALSRQGPGT